MGLIRQRSSSTIPKIFSKENIGTARKHGYEPFSISHTMILLSSTEKKHND
jgi:hypothetical protein